MHTLLKKHFGYDTFRPLQQQIIESVINGKDAVVVMPTGGGKSLCYQLPALTFSGLTIVVSPLIALMKDQVDVLQSNGISAEYINSTLPRERITQVQRKAQSGEVKLLYIAPERLAMQSFQNFLKTLQVSLIAIDEAHCISEWGHDFRPDYRNLILLRTMFPNTPTIALTATATPKVRKDIIEQLSLTNPKKFIASFNRENLILLTLPKKNAFDTLVRLLEKHKNESAIVYCFSRNDTEEIATSLTAEGFKAVPYHAGLDGAVRHRHQELFIKDEVDIMVATIAFGMGIDKPDVRLIVHTTFPKTLESYYQEIGRAGRDGLPSACVALFSYGDKMKHEYFINDIQDENEQARMRAKLNQTVAFFQNPLCRRKQILAYFGEQYEQKNCSGCDVCLSSTEQFDATEIAQKIISCVVRTGSRFGKRYIAEVLSGSKNKRILARRHERLSVFNIAGEHAIDELLTIIDSLVAYGLLNLTEGKYPTLVLTKQGACWLKQKKTLELPRIVKQQFWEEEEETPPYDRVLFEKLRDLRKHIADKSNVPPFVVLSDVSLQEMARYYPVDKTQFSRISGVGEKKLEQLGGVFIKLISRYVSEQGITPKQVPRSRPRTYNKSARTPTARYQQTKQLVQEKRPLAEIARAQGLAQSTIINHIERLIQSGQDLDISYILPPQKDLRTVQNAFTVCGTEYLKPAYEYLQEKYPYDVLRLIRAGLHSTSTF